VEIFSQQNSHSLVKGTGAHRFPYQQNNLE
jgi:hypothetical protein